ncbi:hypothetical protein Tco_1396676, partial [Tanacetum coccineum]
TTSTSGSGTLPGNTVTNPKEDLKGMDKSKSQENSQKQASTGTRIRRVQSRSQRSKALANFHLQGSFLQFPKVIYYLKERKERQGPNV